MNPLELEIRGHLTTIRKQIEYFKDRREKLLDLLEDIDEPDTKERLRKLITQL